MKYRDLIAFEPIDSVKVLRDAEDPEAARRDVETLVVSPRLAEQLTDVILPNLDLDSDTCGSLYQEEDLLATPLRLEGGFACAPESPGLGVELDPEAFERARLRGAAS